MTLATLPNAAALTRPVHFSPEPGHDHPGGLLTVSLQEERRVGPSHVLRVVRHIVLFIRDQGLLGMPMNLT